jgi:DNA (cytosine-5)-methyltransferase 1
MLGDLLLRIGRLQPDTWKCHEKVYKYVKGNLSTSISTKWIGWHRVCGTLVKSEIHTSGLVHPDRERYISLAEAKRVAGISDSYWFSSRKKGIERMGNCVPPPFMKAIAEHIYENYLKYS